MSVSRVYMDPFTGNEYEVDVPETANYIVVKKRGKEKVDGELVGYYDTHEEAREAVYRTMTEEFRTAVDYEPIFVTHANLRVKLPKRR